MSQSYIPKQFQKEVFRFVKIKRGQKRPFEKDWPTINNYNFNDDSLTAHIGAQSNYGIICRFGDLIGIDCDDPIAVDLVEKSLTETFTVETGSGGKHFYFICEDGESTKFYKNEAKDTLADIQFKGKLLVGPDSFHPNGKRYKIINDLPIARIKFSEILDCFKDYQQFSVSKKKSHSAHKSENDPICLEIKSMISMADLLREEGVNTDKNPTECPWHESEGGRCFSFDNETFNCFHCDESGSLFHFYMKQRNVDFLTAKRELAKRTGVKISKRRPYKFDKLSSESNFYNIAKNLIKEQPIWYDERKQWWIWNFEESHWVSIDDIDIKNIINEYSQFPCANYHLNKNMVEVLKLEGRKNKPESPDKNWIQFGNTIVNIQSGKSFPPDSRYFFTNSIPWNLGQSEDTPIMDRIFEDWVGKDYVKTLYEAIAYCTLIDYPFAKIFCLFGDGSNGKSSFINLLIKFLGEINISSTDLDRIQEIRFESACVFKKLMLSIGDTSPNTIMNKTSVLKTLTGNDIMPTEFKNKTKIDYRNYAKIFIRVNNLPPTRDKSDGFYRRFIIIEFIRKFSEKKDILREIPEIEYNNLARKCVAYLKELLVKRKFHNEITWEEKAKKYESLSNPLETYWSKHISENYGEHVVKRDFKTAIYNWCIENKHRCLSDKEIKNFMQEKEVEAERIDTGNNGRVWVWRGISLN